MEAGNRAALGKRLGRWFHLAAPLISLLELVEVFNVISLSSSILTPFKMSFFPHRKRHISVVVSLLGTYKNFFFKKKKKKNHIPFLVSSPSLSVLYFSSEKNELIERRKKHNYTFSGSGLKIWSALEIPGTCC